MYGRIESLARSRPLGNPHQFGNGSGVARDHDFLLKLGFSPDQS
jgi:hypothetical protein